MTTAAPATRPIERAPSAVPAAAPSTAAAPSAAEVLASFRGAPHAHLDVGHSRLAYRRFGSGPDVLFIHGWPLHSATFRGLVPLLAGSFTCHLLDLPGTGQTECGSAAPLDLRSHADTVRRAVELLALNRYGIVSFDSGGVVAREVAADDARVAGLVFGNTEIPGYHSPLLTAMMLLLRIGGERLFLTMLRHRALRRSPLGYGGCFSDLDLLDGEFHELFVAPLLASPDAARGQLRLVEGLDAAWLDRLAETHARIRCPSVLVWGAEDPFFPLAKARPMLAQLAGGAELFAIAGAKLFVHEEHPRAFANHARPFLHSVLG